ncbi:MAG: SIMPL domain-containing protein [Clostridia bacterium]|nr:SIMPL domain-containing protein [Clostridia bacterium]MBP3651760.1 SIMPL domain-containing protein [Clostridia bacterium]
MKRILVMALTILFCFGAALADESKLSVSGSGTVYMKADQVGASLGVMLSGEDLAKVQAQVNATVADICTALEAAGLDEKGISTNYIFVSPRYDYGVNGNDQELVGYTVNNSLSILTENTEEIGAYIDAAFAAGANTFDSISFSVRDDSEARDEALRLAVQEASRKAEVIAAASGKNLEGILEINEGYQNTAYNSGAGASYKMLATEASGAVDTMVRAAQVSVSASVQIIYEIK